MKGFLRLVQAVSVFALLLGATGILMAEEVVEPDDGGRCEFCAALVHGSGFGRMIG